MKCLNCKQGEEFFLVLTRGVIVHTIAQQVLEVEVDGEQLAEKNHAACAKCGSTKVDMTNADIDAFWAIYGQRVERRVKNPE